MPEKCVVFGCSAVAKPREISLYHIPKETSARLAWVRFVRLTRMWDNPTDSSTVCSQHFKPEDFLNLVQFRMGFTKSLKLKPGVTPSIYPESTGVASSSTVSGVSASKPRPAARKRQLQQFMKQMDDMAQEAAVPRFVDASTQTVPVEQETRDCQVSLPLSTESIAIQVGAKTKNFGQICNRLPRKRSASWCSTPKKKKLDLSDIEWQDDENSDPSYLPEDDSFTERQSPETVDPPISPAAKEQKFIVFKSCLMSLFEVCPTCSHPCAVDIKYTMGTLVCIQQDCPRCNFCQSWKSQPYVQNIPAGNLLLSGAILANGMSYVKTLRMLESLHVACISQTTYKEHAVQLVQPTIYHMWEQEQKQVVKSVMERGGQLVLGGDGRVDSPGHCGKFGSYNVLDLVLNKIIDIELVQSNETGGSHGMEKEGLIRAVNKLTKEFPLVIKTLVTDRHPQIIKYVKDNLVDTEHVYDVWHVAKSIKKRLLAKSKRNPELMEWMRSILNHLYWSAMSSAGLPREVIEAKWKSVTNHVQNIHEGHGELFEKCEHASLSSEDARKKKWLKPDSDAFVALEEVVYNKLVLKDVRRLSTLHQTSSLEAFHSLLLQFAPKLRAFSHHGILCRHYLAALHYNENSDRKFITKEDGTIQCDVYFPKAKHKQGGYSLRRRKEKPNYGYVNTLLETLVTSTPEALQEYRKEWEKVVVPATLSSTFEHPSASQAMETYASRFSTAMQ